MDKKRKPADKKASKTGAIIAGIVFVLGMIGNIDIDVWFSIIVIGIIAGAIALIVYAAKKGALKTKKAVFSTESFKQKVDTAIYKAREPDKKTYTNTEQKYYDSDCEEQFSKHDHNRRIQQLDSFLHSGIIDRKEYNILKEKYMQSES